MEENKNLVISYRYYVEKDYPELDEISGRISRILSNGPTDPAVTELDDLIFKQCALLREQEVTVYKEYPEFLVKDFKTKEELFDFLDEDEPMILRELNMWFENVPECLKQIGISSTHDSWLDCKEFIEKKHGCWEG